MALSGAGQYSLRDASTWVAFIGHGVANPDGCWRPIGKRCHPPYEMCRHTHAIEFRNEYVVVDMIKSFAIVDDEHSHESIWLIGGLAPRVDHLHQGVRRTGAR